MPLHISSSEVGSLPLPVAYSACMLLTRSNDKQWPRTYSAWQLAILVRCSWLKPPMLPFTYTGSVWLRQCEDHFSIRKYRSRPVRLNPDRKSSGIAIRQRHPCPSTTAMPANTSSLCIDNNLCCWTWVNPEQDFSSKNPATTRPQPEFFTHL